MVSTADAPLPVGGLGASGCICEPGRRRCVSGIGLRSAGQRCAPPSRSADSRRDRRVEPSGSTSRILRLSSFDRFFDKLRSIVSSTNSRCPP